MWKDLSKELIELSTIISMNIFSSDSSFQAICNPASPHRSEFDKKEAQNWREKGGKKKVEGKGGAKRGIQHKTTGYRTETKRVCVWNAKQ